MDTETLVRRYFATVSDLASTEDELRSLLDPGATFHELPNPIAPSGARRDVEATVAGFLAGKGRLEDQSIEIHEVLVSGDQAAVRSTWRGTIAGATLTAHMAGFVRVHGGRIVEHRTYDCYEPLPDLTAAE